MTRIDRRRLLASAASAATMAMHPALAQTGEVAFAARLRALTGMSPLPRPLVEGPFRVAAEAGDLRAVLSDATPDGPRERILRAAYSGIWTGPGEDAPPERLVFADALKWAAIAETHNVISWCGGVRSFWADPPEDPA